ncbi:MAG TPA: CvpA family protein [Pyrinomonadaceae bacterium]|nr:CvpA family protein [Pyrinomonadaceae bacterium]
MALNYIDVLLVLLVLLSVAYGWQRGFILGLLDLLRWIGSLLLGLRFYQPVARWLGPRVSWSEVWDLPVAFVLTALTAGVLIHLLGRGLLRYLPEGAHERHGNRIFGLFPGLINGLITAAIAAALLMAIPLPDGVRTTARESALANRLAAYTERLEEAFTPIFDDAIRQTLNRLTIRPESNERVDLPYTVANSKPRPELEAQMLELVNQERAAAGLGPLAADPELKEVARQHSADMFARGYFSHITPEGHSPFDRIRAAGITFRIAGENLALAPTVAIAHTGLMNSPGHRANILRPQFGRVGIGIMDGGMRGLMVTQKFRN